MDNSGQNPGHMETVTRDFTFFVEYIPKTLTRPEMCIIKLSEEELNRLGEKVYTVQSWFKVISEEPAVRDWYKNFRIGVMNNINPNIDISTTVTETEVIDDDEVSIDPRETEVIDNTDYENLTPEEIFDYAEYWGNTVNSLNTFESITCEFPYNPAYPVYIIFTGDWLEGDPENNTIEFTEPCIIETRVYNGFEQNGNFPIPILNTIGNEDVSDLVLPLFSSSNGIVLYNFPLGENYSVSDTFVISGIELTADIEYSDQLSLSVKLRKPDGEVRERSIIVSDADIEDQDSSISIGGKYDLWGFKISEMENLEDWEIELVANAIFSNGNNTSEIKLKNIQVIVHFNNIKKNFINILVEGENVRHYGMFVQKIKVPPGLNTDTKYIAIDGTDTNDAYRMNLKSKEIEIEFRVIGCTLKETTEMLQQLAKLFVNERDELNRPIPKRLDLEHYPDVHFMYILEDVFDADPVTTNYTSKVKLNIPSGTAFANEDTVSSNVGVNQGIAKVNPIINIIPTGDVVEIIEKGTNQKLIISCTDWTTSNTVEIDCINRKVTILDWVNPETELPELKDITEKRDYNSDWFVIHNEYNFIPNNCIIQTVIFTERW